MQKGGQKEGSVGTHAEITVKRGQKGCKKGEKRGQKWAKRGQKVAPLGHAPGKKGTNILRVGISSVETGQK